MMADVPHDLSSTVLHTHDDDEVRWRGIHGWAIISFLVLWELVYQVSKVMAAKYCSQWTKISQLGGSYMAAFLNACVCSVLGCWIVVAYLLFADARGRALVLDDGPAVGAVYLAAQSFIGWLMMDCCHLLTHFPTLGGVDMLLHHFGFLVMAAIGYGYRVVPFICGWLLLGEVSSIPLNIRWFLIQSGRGDSRALAYVNYAFAGCFLLFRVFILNAGLVDYVVELRPVLLAPPCNAEAWAVNVFCILLVGCSLLNLYWMAKIIQMAIKPREAAGRLGDQTALVRSKELSVKEDRGYETPSPSYDSLVSATPPTNEALPFPLPFGMWRA